MDDEKRSYERFQVWFPMRIGTGDDQGLAISYDASAKGLLIASPASLQVDDVIDVTFAMPPPEGNEKTVKGRVVRVGKNEADPDGMWPNRLAVEFEEEVPGLEDVLRAHREKED